MKSRTTYMSFQPSMIALIDHACMALYRHARRNARRIAHLAATLLPLIVLLVGSCKTSEMSGLYGGSAGPEQFRAALFPDSAKATATYRPAAGYVSRAQTYIKDAPESLKLLTGREVAWLFGRPRMQRRDADARVWQYRANGCIVDFYFYGARDEAAQVSYVDVRAKDQLPEKARAKCLGHIMDGADSASSGA